MDLDMQIELFDVALDEIERLADDLVNQCLEITLTGEGDQESIEITLYELPAI